MTYSDGKLPAMRPLEGERATKWRGGAVRQEPQMTLHPGRPPFGGQGSLCASSLHAASYTLLPLRGISPQGETRDCAAEPCAHLRGECAGMVAKTSGYNETQSREISCHLGLATFRREISPLRFATVEMTGAVSSRAEEHIGMGGKNLNLLNPMNLGRGAAHPAAPFRLAALATHPRKGGGQVTWRRRTLPSKLVVYGWRGTAKPPKAAL